MARRSKKNKAVGNKASAIAPLKGLRTEDGAQKKDLSPSNSEPSKCEERISSLPGKGTVTQLPARIRGDWLWGLILLLAVILAYQPVCYAGYIWDDDFYVTNNPVIVGPLGLKEIWTTRAADICPLTITMFWMEHALWGLATLPYHLVNVLMHGACAVVLWRVLRSLQIPGAWLGAALWALHPVQVDSVAWITEMKNTQSGLFFLLSILFFVRWLRAKAKKGDERIGVFWNYGLTLLFAAFAMASKSSTVILPVVLCLCAWWMEGQWQWRRVFAVLPIFLMSIVASLSSMWTQGLQTAHDPQWTQSWPERFVTASNVVWFYLGKLLWPHPLIAVYPRWHIDAGQWFSYLPLLAVIIVLFVLGLKRESWSRPAFFAFSYFLVALLPVLGLVTMSFSDMSFVANHFQYLAGMGPLALAGTGMIRLAEFVIPRRPWLQAILGAGVLVILGLLSWQRTWAYESEETLWTDTLAKNPNCWVGYNNLGNVFLQKGLPDEAIIQFEKAVEVYPDYAEAHNNLGTSFSQKGLVNDAITQYQEALEIDPNFAEAYSNLGNIYFQKGQIDEAIAQHQKALRIDPNNAIAHNNFGWALFQKGQVDEAINHYQKALEINPNYAEAHSNLGIALFQKGQVDKAMAEYQKALEINPHYAKAYYNLGNIFYQTGQMDEAVNLYQKALAIDPSYAEIHNNLGNAFAQKGRMGEAIGQFQEALRLKPDYAAAQDNLAKVKAIAAQRAQPK